MPNGLYILNENGEPAPAKNTREWALFMAMPLHENLRRVALTRFSDGSELVTTFLGVSFFVHELWESCYFFKDLADSRVISRCGGSREQAEGMHEQAVRAVRAEHNLEPVSQEPPCH